MDIFLSILKFPFSALRNLFKFLFFEYKHETSIRNLYIEHAKKLRIFFTEYFKDYRLTAKTRQMLFDMSEEAGLYLHRDIVKLIENIKEIVFEQEMLNIKLDRNMQQEDRDKICDKMLDNDNKIGKLSNEYMKLYRKQILQDAMVPKMISEFKENYDKKLQEKKIKLQCTK